MNVQLPSDVSEFVESLVSSGEYPSANEAIVEGIRLLKSRELFRQEVRLGFEQLDNGQGVDADEVYERAAKGIREIKDEKSLDC